MRVARRPDDRSPPGAPPAPASARVARREALVRLLGLVATAAIPIPIPVSAMAAENNGELTGFDLVHTEDGVFLSYAVNLELSRSVEDALSKAVPLFFVAEVNVFRSRFYWRDLRVGQAVRRWRVVYQPLTSTYRVTFDGGLSQSYPSRAEAFAAIGRATRWKVAEAGQVEDGSRHYVEFDFRLDTSQLPRPMQIGIGGQADWTYQVERTQRVGDRIPSPPVNAVEPRPPR